MISDTILIAIESPDAAQNIKTDTKARIMRNSSSLSQGQGLACEESR